MASTTRHAGGRPPKFAKEQLRELAERFAQYIEETDIPIIAEFCYTRNIGRETIYDNPEFATLRKKAIAKKESQLEKLGLLNVINTTMAIFSLKQLGWRDRHDFEHTGKDGGPIEVSEARERLAGRIAGIADRARAQEDSAGPN